jgi:hypothetical protein
MPTWRNYSTPPLSITIEGNSLTISGEPPLSTAETNQSALLQTKLALFDFETQMEIEAYLKELPSIPQIRGDISVIGRQRYARYYSDNMGRGASTYNIWLMGRHMIIEVRGKPRLECSFDEFLKKGFGDGRESIIGPEAGMISIAVQRLSEYPCFCETGAETPSQHGTIKKIVSEQHPQAPIDHRVTVGRCSVCHRGWTFTESGDSHYSYHYSVREYPPSR